MDIEHLKQFSADLAQVMEDIGVNKGMISLRRHFFGLMDLYRTICDDEECTFFTFGSQSEGSTTTGMGSDYDILFYCKWQNIAERNEDFQNGKDTFIILKEPMCLPQCCCLAVLGRLENNSFCIAYDKSISKSGEFNIDKHFRLLSNSMYRLNIALNKTNNGLVRQHGPAVTKDNMDTVVSVRCMTLPDVCRVLFTRPRPGHWPKKETLLKAEQCEMYMVHPGVLGHTFGYDNERRRCFIKVKYQSEYVDSQFRMSTNMTERLLMYDLNIVQMKAYVVTKMIRKEFLLPLVDDRLSTFHMKTALLFTVERVPESIWRDDNLVQCVIYCLNTLKRFLKKRYCPHYTIDYVNLFAEKLQVNEVNIVKDKLTEMIHFGLSCLKTLNMDNVGERLRCVEYNKHKITCVQMQFETVACMLACLHYSHIFADVKNQKTMALAIQSALLTEHVYRTELEFMLYTQYSTIASHEASNCIANDTEVTSDIINRYETSLSAHTPINHLRYASMLVCTKQFERAIGVLDKIETAIINQSFNQKIASSHKPTDILMAWAATIPTALYFVTGEINCVPNHLIYEKFRAITEDERKCSNFKVHVVSQNIKIVVASDLKPFFYYLQYLSSKNESKRRQALEKLLEYCEDELKHQLSEHLETALNMLGHVLELENKIPEAWRIYRQSVTITPSYNAAYWHLFRIFGHSVYCTFK